MQGRKIKNLKGFTLMEIMVASVMVVITALGALSYQYLGARHIRQAHAELSAARIGQLLIEDWKGTGGADKINYDATTMQVGFEKPSGSETWDYAITVDSMRLFIWLDHSDVAVDTEAGVTLRQISLTVRWRKDLADNVITDEDSSLYLTTYVRRDQD